MNRRILFAGALCAMAAFAGPSAADEKIGGEINILSWGNYIDFALKPFEEKYGVKVNIDYYGDEQEAMNKIRAASTGIHDIVFLGKYKGRIGKIDKSNEQVWRTALSLGYSYGPLSDDQWKKLEEKLDENMAQVRTVYSHNDEMAQLLSSGEIWIGDSDDGSYR